MQDNPVPSAPKTDAGMEIPIQEMREWSWKRQSLGEPDSSLAEIQLEGLLLIHHKKLLDLANAALKQPRTQITRQQVRRIGLISTLAEHNFIGHLRALGIEVID